jgi:hypothetical protein
LKKKSPREEQIWTQVPVTDGKGLSQLVCPREWKKYEEGDE